MLAYTILQRHRTPSILSLIVTVLACWTSSAAANSISKPVLQPQDIVEQTLDDSAPPWFDPATDKIRTLSDFQTTFELEEGTQSDARGTAAIEFSKPISDFWDSIVDFFEQLSSYLPDFGWISELHWLWWVFAIILVIVLAFAIAYFLKLDALQRLPGFGDKKQRKKRKAATIEDLPFELEGEALSLDNLLQRAQAEQRNGNLRLAMIYLFSHMLLKMDEKELITLRKGKTNRVYAAEIKKSDRKSLPLYNSVMMTFEKCFFGHHPLQNDEVTKLLKETESWA